VSESSAEERFRIQRQVQQLYSDLVSATQEDREQEVEHWAIPVIDAVLNQARDLLPAGHPLRGAMQGLITPEMIEQRTAPLRALEAQIIVGQLRVAIGWDPPSGR
jgi:hypothetical protein